jgi:hypothetical protein
MGRHRQPRKRLPWSASLAVPALALSILTGGVARAAELPSPLKPEAVLKYAAEHRAEITAAKARAAAAAEVPKQVRALPEPMVMASIDHLPISLEGINASFMAQQEFPLSGVLGARERAAAAEAKVVTAQAVTTKLDVEYQALAAYLMVVEAQRMIVVLDDQMAIAKQVVAVSQARLAASQAAGADVLRAELRDDAEALGQILVPVQVTPSRRFVGSSSPASLGGSMPEASSGYGTGTFGGSMGGGRAMAGPAAPPAGGDETMGNGMGAASAPMSVGGAGPAFVPLSQLAKIETIMGPPMIKSEMGSLTGWVYIDIEGRDQGGYVADAKGAVEREIKLPVGYRIKWTGQYELLERVRERMAFVLPLTLAIVFVILYLNFRGVAQTLIVMTAVPFAAVGAVWTLYAMQFNTSIAVWVGMIALLGVAAETASVMVVYLDGAWKEGRESGGIVDVPTLIIASVAAGSKRVRPLLMTVMTNILGLLPILIDQGVGSDVAKRIAAPMWGGLLSLTLLTLLVVPAVYVIWRSFELRRTARPLAIAG